jgi:ABC-type antimicrobial peptide transport system permease subunit
MKRTTTKKRMMTRRRREAMLGDLATIASRNIARKKARMALVVVALGLSIALITSIYTSTAATVANSQNLIDEANQNADKLTAMAQANARRMADGANANASATMNSTIASTDALINETNEKTQRMIDDILASYVETVNQTEIEMTMITVTNSTRSSGLQLGGPGQQRQLVQQSSLPIGADIIANISAIDGVEAVVPIIQQSFGHNTTPPDGTVPGNGSRPGNGTQQGGPGTGGPPFVRQTTDYNIYGVPLNATLVEKYHLLPSEITGGVTLDGTDGLAVLIHEDLVSYFNASAGGGITINGTNLTVAGVYYSGLQNKSVYLGIDEAALVAGLEPGSAYTLQVYAANISEVDNLTDTLRYYFPNFTVSPFKNTASSSTEYVQQQQQRQIQQLNQTAQQQVRQLQTARDREVAQLQAGLNATLNQSAADLATQVKQYQEARATQVKNLDNDQVLVQTIGNLIVLVSAVTAGLIVVFMMFYTVKERTREIGVYKALGFTGNDIMTQFVLEGSILGFLGGAVGIAMAMLIGRVVSGALIPSSDIYVPSNPTVQFALVMLALTAALGAAGALYPAWKASRLSAVEAMRNV